MKYYPLIRLKLIVAGNYSQFIRWLNENPITDDENIVFVVDIQSLLGRQKENVEWVKYGTWYENKDAIEAVCCFLSIPESEFYSS